MADLTPSHVGRLEQMERSGKMGRPVSESAPQHARRVRAAMCAVDAARSRLDEVTGAEDAKVSLAAVLAAATRRLMAVTTRPDEITGLSIRVLRQMERETSRN
jgi:hypothetical protein